MRVDLNIGSTPGIKEKREKKEIRGMYGIQVLDGGENVGDRSEFFSLESFDDLERCSSLPG